LPAIRSEETLSKNKNREDGPDALASKMEALCIPGFTRHILLCCDQTEPECCDRTESLLSWEFLKRRLSELGLSGRGGTAPSCNCLRVCQGGTIAVVSPAGTWSRGCNEPVLERIVREHLIEGRSVQEYVIAERPLPMTK